MSELDHNFPNHIRNSHIMTRILLFDYWKSIGVFLAANKFIEERGSQRFEGNCQNLIPIFFKKVNITIESPQGLVVERIEEVAEESKECKDSNNR